MNQKGTLGAALFALAIIALILSSDLSAGSSAASDALARQQIAKENALRAENALTLLDRQTSNYIDVNSGLNAGTCNITDADGTLESELRLSFNTMLAKFTENYHATSCKVLLPPAEFNVRVTGGDRKFEIRGSFECTTMLPGDGNVTKIVQFEFDKTVANSPPCTIRDDVSNCIEEPSFSC